MGHKSTNAEIEQRVKAVYGLLVKSYSRFQILHTRPISGM